MLGSEVWVLGFSGVVWVLGFGRRSFLQRRCMSGEALVAARDVFLDSGWP